MPEEKSDTLQFKTQNAQLSAALMDVGCELAPQADGGPAENLYTLGFLRDRKIGTGKKLEDAAREAYERRVPGIVTYVFKRSALLEKMILVWDAMVDEMRRAEHEGTPPIMPVVSDETIVQVVYVHALNRAAFLDLPFFNEPLVGTLDIQSRKSVPIKDERNGGFKPGQKTIVKGRAKVWRLGSKPSITKHLKV